MSATKLRRPSFSIATVAAFLASAALAECRAAELHVGGATVSITPDRPVALAGQMHTRVAREVESPVTATALALESREGDKALDRAIMVSCDLVVIDAGVLEQVRRRVKDRLPDFDVQKLVLNATHTHTAPVQKEGDYEIPKDGVMQPAEYAEFLSSRVAEVAVKAWESRRPGRVGWGLGHAVVAQNRRSVYADGRAQMYGPTDKPDFRGIEGSEDQGVEVLFFWDLEGKLLATAVNVACPSQEVEGLSAVNADFWHEVRESLRARHGKDLLVLGWTGAAGDQSPHLMYRKRAEERMRTLRGLTRLEELSRRIVAAWEEAYEGARKEQHADVPLIHKVETIELPVRAVTEAEAAEARSKVETLSKEPRNRTVGALAPGCRGPLRAAGGRPRRALRHGSPRHPARRRRDRHQCLRALHRVRDPDEGPQPGAPDIRHPAGRAGLVRADRTRRPGRGLQRDRGE